MAAQVSLVAANLGGVVIESFLYGIFLVLYLTSTYFLIQRARQSDARTHAQGDSPRRFRFRHFKSPMFIAGTLIALTVTAHWIVDIIRVFDAFVAVDDGENPLAFFADLAQPTEVVKIAIFVTTVLISDAMIIYRLYIIWSYNKPVIIFPVATWVGLAITGYVSTYHFSQYLIGQNVFEIVMGRWITCDATFTLATNVYCSAFIAWRVWQSQLMSSPIGGANLMNVLATFIESAALYTSWNIFFITSYEIKSNVQFPALDTWSCVAGISYMLISVRVGLGWAQTAHLSASTPSQSHVFTSHIATMRPSGVFDGPQSHAMRPSGVFDSSQNYVMRPLSANVGQIAEKDDEDEPSPAYSVTKSPRVSDAGFAV